MSAYPVHEISFDLPASTVTRTNGGFKESDEEVIGRWVQRSTGNTVILLQDNGRPLGIITRITAGKVAVAIGPILVGKRAADTALAVGVTVTGATRVVASGGTAEPGFVKRGRTDSVANAETATGNVLDGGGTSSANTEGTTCEVLMY